MKRIRELDGAKISTIVVREGTPKANKQMFIQTDLGVMALSVSDYDFVVFSEEEEQDEEHEDLGDSDTTTCACGNTRVLKSEGRSPDQGP